MLHKTTTPNGEICRRSRNPEATGSPIVMIHGAGGAKEVWLPLSRRLAALLPDRPIVFPDLPGHGESTGHGRDRIEDYADDLIAWVRAEGWAQVDLIGHSMGGAIAQVMAAQWPEYVRRLTLLGTGPKLRVVEVIFQVLPEHPDKLAELMGNFAFGAGTPPLAKEAALKQIASLDGQVALGDFTACNHWDVAERLVQITAPTLIVAGENDYLAPPRLNQKLADGIAGARIEIIPAVGHMLPLECDRELADLLAKHLRN